MNRFYSIRIITFAKKLFHHPFSQSGEPKAPLFHIQKQLYHSQYKSLLFTATTSPERIDGSMLSPYTRMLICLLGDPSIIFLVNV